MRTIRPSTLLIPLLLALLCGCGNKGDLVKPTPPADAEPTPAQTPPDSGQH